MRIGIVILQQSRFHFLGTFHRLRRLVFFLNSMNMIKAHWKCSSSFHCLLTTSYSPTQRKLVFKFVHFMLSLSVVLRLSSCPMFHTGLLELRLSTYLLFPTLHSKSPMFNNLKNDLTTSSKRPFVFSISIVCHFHNPLSSRV